MVDGRCSKQFPKQFQEQTLYGDDGYPSYKHPDDGTTFTHPTSGHVFRNCDVVPHNAYLSAKYNCHINCEICASVKAIKYIHKYIFKGSDHTTIKVSGENGGDQVCDEVKEYLDAHYIFAIESCWHIFEFNMHKEKPNVYHPIHLPDQ